MLMKKACCYCLNEEKNKINKKFIEDNASIRKFESNLHQKNCNKINYNYKKKFIIKNKSIFMPLKYSINILLIIILKYFFLSLCISKIIIQRKLELISEIRLVLKGNGSQQILYYNYHGNFDNILVNGNEGKKNEKNVNNLINEINNITIIFNNNVTSCIKMFYDLKIF